VIKLPSPKAITSPRGHLASEPHSYGVLANYNFLLVDFRREQIGVAGELILKPIL
jgi:hypothetical protein